MENLKFSIPNDEKAITGLRDFCNSMLGQGVTTLTVGDVSVTETTVVAPLGGPETTVQTNQSPLTVDGKGVQWSAEHHAATKTTKADGTWKAKKGGDKAARLVYEASFAAPVAPPLDTAPPQGVNPAAATGPTFADVMNKITDLVTKQLINPEGVQAISTQLGLANVTELANNPILVPQFLVALQAIG